MAKPELGTKRLCPGCNAKFYDLHKTPIVCPMCEAVFVLPKAPPPRPRRQIDPVPAPLQAMALPVAAEAVIAADKADGEDIDAVVTAEKPDGEEADVGVPILERLDDDDDAAPPFAGGSAESASGA